MAVPPSDAGAAHVTTALVLDAIATSEVGAPGPGPGVTELEGSDAGPAPAEFVAVTVNVYAVPFASPVTVQPIEPPVVQVAPSGELVTV
jgi:hypothetical protein